MGSWSSLEKNVFVGTFVQILCPVWTSGLPKIVITDAVLSTLVPINLRGAIPVF